LDSDLLHACDVNMRLSNAAFLGTSVKGEVLESFDLYITNCGLAAVDFNRAHVKDPGSDLAAPIARAEAYFRAAELPFGFTVRSDLETPECAAALERAGYVRTASIPAMVLDPIRAENPSIPGFAVREVRTQADLEQFQSTSFIGFGFPPTIGRLFLTEQFLRTPGAVLYLGTVDGEPACTSSVVRTSGIAGVYWVATLPEFRGRGLGEAITWAAVAGGAADGCRVASLQASDMGRPVYERMGFTTPFHYVKFDKPA